MTDPEKSERMAQLEARIKAFKGKDAPRPHQDSHYSQAQLAWRMVIELVTGLLIGFGMGYGLDSLFGTMPVFLVLFTLLGLAAGIRTMMRTAGEIRQDPPAGDAGEDHDETETRKGDEGVKNGD